MNWFSRRLNKQVLHELIDCLVAALEERDAYTGGHSSKVAELTCAIAREMGIRGKQLETIHLAAHLHDIGKIGIPESILHKPDKLTPDERREMERHPGIGYAILSKSRGMKQISLLVLHHHERWDGSGYPAGLAGEDIPVGARIIAVADAMDAMTSDRPYRRAMSQEECLERLCSGCGSQFDPVVVAAVRRMRAEEKNKSAGTVQTMSHAVQ